MPKRDKLDFERETAAKTEGKDRDNGKENRQHDLDGTPARGGVTVALDFSPDANQTYMFVINQQNSQVEIVERLPGKMLGHFGVWGKQPGFFDQIHGIAVDSKNNVYLTENRGRRAHKFRPGSQ